MGLRDEHAGLGEPASHPQFRRETAITTYTVVAQTLWVENFPTSFGVFADAVRTLP